MSTAPSSDRERDSGVGVVYGLAAYLWWGFVVVYFKAVAHVPALEVLAHRVVWSVVLLALLVRARGRVRESLGAVRQPRTFATLLLTTVLIAGNWFTFIWAVGHDYVLQASLGYYINPLVNVLLGFTFLGERLHRLQWISVALAIFGVGYLTVKAGEFPLVALILAFSFGFYGLLRKTMAVDGLVGLTAEATLLLPVALGYLSYLSSTGALVFGNHGLRTDLLLVAAGAVTALPLLWFANAARRLHYATVGFLQYIAPSLQFLLAVSVYGEDFAVHHVVAFACIWSALLLYSTDAVLRRRYRSSKGDKRIGASPDA